MIYTVWFPKVRSTVTNVWQPHDPIPLIELMDTWAPVLPSFIRTEILEHLVVRKLDEAIANWNPKKSSSRRSSSALPHLWLFPWLQYLAPHHVDPKASSGLVADVKRKFRTLIDSWDYSRGLIPGLAQWKAVLRPSAKDDTWTPLLLNHIVPSLSSYFRKNFQVAPQDQEPYMPVLTSLFAWRDILGDKIIAQILVEEFFPMWLDVLHQWLTLEGVNYGEISQWFDFWRSVIPQGISEQKVVEREWTKGSDMINNALDLGDRAKDELPAPKKPSRHRNAKPAAPAAVAPEELTAEKEEPVSFRHNLEDWAMAHDLQFIPEKSTLEAAGPVYRVTASPIGKGGVLIYIKRDEIFAQIKRGSWSQLGQEMDALFELAHR
jgi:tuftelin-interacting protein 11